MQIVMRTAAEVLNEENSKPKLTTGNGDLDSLIDGITQGHFYLFYSNDQEVLDRLIHRVLVSSILPIENGGFNAKALYFNTCNYHRGKTILNPSSLAVIAKCVGVEPEEVFQNIYSISAFNEIQQLTAAQEIAELVEKDKAVKTVVVHNLTRFIETSKKPSKPHQFLKQIIRVLKRVAFENNVALVVSCTALRTGRGRIPKPVGGTYLRHEASVVVLLNSMQRESSASVKVTLVKHPYKRTPQTLILYVPSGGINLMGRITPSFRQQFHKLIKKLRRSSGFQNTLINLEHKKAFDQLLKEAWSTENAAMANSGIPCLMDVLNLMANIHNKKCIEELRKLVLEHDKSLSKQDKKVKHAGEGKRDTY